MLYLLGFSISLGNEKHRASRYLGYCEDGREQERLAERQAGHGAHITAVAVERGATLTILWTGKGDKRKERKLKKAGHYDRLLKEKRKRAT